MMVTIRAEAVFQDETRDALLIEPARVNTAFVIGEMRVAAAGTNHHRRARGFIGSGEEDGECGRILGFFAERARCAGGR